MPLKELTRPTTSRVDDDADARRLLDGLDLDTSALHPGPGRNAFGRLVDQFVPAGTGVDEYDQARRLAGAA